MGGVVSIKLRPLHRRERTQALIDTGLCRPPTWSGIFGGKNILSLAGFEPPDHPALSLVAIPTTLSLSLRREFVVIVSLFCEYTGDKETKNKKA
jgi:hypothetical protein